MLNIVLVLHFQKFLSLLLQISLVITKARARPSQGTTTKAHDSTTVLSAQVMSPRPRALIFEPIVLILWASVAPMNDPEGPLVLLFCLCSWSLMVVCGHLDLDEVDFFSVLSP